MDWEAAATWSQTHYRPKLSGDQLLASYSTGVLHPLCNNDTMMMMIIII